MESVQVEIFGQFYNIKGKDDTAYIRKLAAFVDEKMKEVGRGTKTADPHRVAILTALTISDELYQAREYCRGLEKTATESMERLLDMTEDLAESSHE